MRQSALSTEEWLSWAWGRAEAAPPSLLALWDLALTWRKTLLTNDKFLLRVQKPTSSSFCLLLETLGNVVNIGSNGQRSSIVWDVWVGFKPASPLISSVWKILR